MACRSEQQRMRFFHRDLVHTMNCTIITSPLHHALPLHLPHSRPPGQKKRKQVHLTNTSPPPNSFFASPIGTSTPITSLMQQIQTHQALISRVQELQDDIEANHMPNTIPGWSKGKFRVSEGCRSCFLIIGPAWSEEGVSMVCQGDMLMRSRGNGDVGWSDVD